MKLAHPLEYRNIVPVSGGLHFQKTVLLSYGQVLSVSGLPEQLNGADLSISGAGNVMVSVDNIASSSYLVTWNA